MSALGYCHKCNTTHSLPTNAKAIQQVKSLHQQFTSSFNNIKHGKMIGVLLTKENVTLKAFAGAINGQWNIKGWSTVCGGVGTSPSELPKYQTIQNKTNTLEKQQQQLQYQYERSKQDNNNNDNATRTTLLLLQQEIQQITTERKRLAVAALTEMRRHQHVTNFEGEKAILQDVFGTNNTTTKMPAGVGDCCAPKLLQDAARQNLTPIAIAEIVVGGDNDGKLRDACVERCQPVLGFMLCGINES